MKEKKPLDCFECATPIAGIEIMLTPADIKKLVPALTVAQAGEFLQKHYAPIAVQMLAAGMEAALQIAQRKGALS
jgi:hypothetical protein